MGSLHARAEDGCEVEDGDEKEDGDAGADSGSLTVRSDKIKRGKTTMRREIPQLCRHTGCLCVTFSAFLPLKAPPKSDISPVDNLLQFKQVQGKPMSAQIVCGQRRRRCV